MNNSESGRKLNQAVNTTSKAVGGAILQAKGAITNWWSAMTTQPPTATSSSPPPPPLDDCIETDTYLQDNNLIVNDNNPSSIFIDSENDKNELNCNLKLKNTDGCGGIVEIGREAVSTMMDTNRKSAGEVFTV